MVIKNNAEFGVELALAVPYAYWLHEQDQLETVMGPYMPQARYLMPNQVETFFPCPN